MIQAGFLVAYSLLVAASLALRMHFFIIQLGNAQAKHFVALNNQPIRVKYDTIATNAAIFYPTTAIINKHILRILAYNLCTVQRFRH